MTPSTTPRPGRTPERPSRRRFLIGAGGLALTAAEPLIAHTAAADPRAKAQPLDRPAAERFMRRAIELSRKGWEAGDGPPFGAVVVKAGEIVGESANRRFATKDATAHAEMEAIRLACRRLGSFSLAGCELYASAQPCPMCLCATYWARIDRVYYGNGARDSAAVGFDDEVFYRELGRPPEQRAVPEIQLLRDEALAVFTDYAARRRPARP